MKKEKIEYIDVSEYFKPGIYFHFFIGGRGTGKTYSSLRYCLETMKPFIYMRRTLDELKECCDSEKHGEGENPFKSINKDFDTNYGMCLMTAKTAGIFVREENEKGNFNYVVSRGYGVALSSIATMRGIDLSDADTLFYDEFITEKHVRKIKAEGEAFLNAIETIGRNRELAGMSPLTVILCANAFNIYNPIFSELGIISVVERMINRNQEHYYNDKRGLGIHLLKNTESFKKAKKQTALYRLTHGTNFYDMALNNTFAYNDFSLISYRRIQGYRPICCINNNYYIFMKKGSTDFYITYTPGRCENFNIENIQDRKRFYERYGKMLKEYFIEGNITFESYEIKMIFLDSIGIK